MDCVPYSVAVIVFVGNLIIRECEWCVNLATGREGYTINHEVEGTLTFDIFKVFNKFVFSQVCLINMYSNLH